MNHRILIIDDSPTDRRIYKRFLEMNGYSVAEAATAADGVKLAKAAEYICVILDYRLPDQTGLSILGELKKSTCLPIVVVSGEPDPLLVSEAFRHGASAFLNKDFLSSETLHEEIQKAIR